jgi:glyoxylase-like metal-dependent hydrolase (beta-lactamase superfamily II)
MLKRICGAAALMFIAAQGAFAQDARAVIGDAAKAIGADTADAVSYFGVATNYNLGQNSNANNPWPRGNLNDYNRAIDFRQPASRATAVTYAMPPQGNPASIGQFQQLVTPAQPAWTQQLEIWITPWGFLKGAAANAATVKATGSGAARQFVVSWSPAQPKSPSGQSYKVVGYINAASHLVERVETWVEHPLFGDMHVDTAYSGYRDANGLKFPAEIHQTRAGYPAFDMFVQGATKNPQNIAMLLTPSAPPAGGPPPGGGAPPQVGSEKMAEGVYRITGGYVALAVEFADYILVYEPGPQNEARSQAIIDEAKRVIPGKPIRYGIVSHHHADHTSGMAAAVGEGITLVMHESAKAYMQKWLTAPRTLASDAITRTGRKPVIETVADKRVFTDGNRVVEVYLMHDIAHADGLLAAYLPKEGIVAYADMFNMPAPNAPAPAAPVWTHAAMADNLERLGLKYDRLVSVHAPVPDRPISKADLYATLPGRPVP